MNKWGTVQTTVDQEASKNKCHTTQLHIPPDTSKNDSIRDPVSWQQKSDIWITPET